MVASAEEIAFNDPPSGAAERMVLDGHLARLVTHARLSAFQRFVQQVADGYFVKYAASVVALLVYAAPLYATAGRGERRSQDDVTQDYIRAMRLLQARIGGGEGGGGGAPEVVSSCSCGGTPRATARTRPNPLGPPSSTHPP